MEIIDLFWGDFTVTHNCNVFSKSFTVKGLDPNNKKMFEQTWTENIEKPRDRK